MNMPFHQKQFFAFRNGAPSIHSLRAHPSKANVLVTTDRYVQQLGFDATTKQYRWQDIPFSDDPSGTVDVIASGVIACPGRERIVVAYAEVGDSHEGGENGTNADGSDQLFLSVVDPRTLSFNGSDPPPAARKPTLTKTHSTDGSAIIHHDESKYSIRFELVAAPTVIMSARAKVSNVEFNGVILFRMESMVAIGFVDDLVKSDTPSEACVRLSNDQFAAFFPEFAEFHHPVLTVDTLEIQAEERGWIAMGCADGFIRVFSGALRDNILSGPFETREVHVDGPVLSVSLFTQIKDGRRVCNLVAACAIGHAIVYEDLFGQSAQESVTKQVLPGSDQYDSIFSVRAVDIDLDGDTELLIGTDNQSLLAYKRRAQESDEPSAVKPWSLLSPDQWQVRAFGGVYSLAWLDLNGDGVHELVVASSTGVYVYEAAPQLVVRRLEELLEAALPPP